MTDRIWWTSGSAEPTADDLGKSNDENEPTPSDTEPVRPTSPAWLQARAQPIREDTDE